MHAEMNNEMAIQAVWRKVRPVAIDMTVLGLTAAVALLTTLAVEHFSVWLLGPDSFIFRPILTLNGFEYSPTTLILTLIPYWFAGTLLVTIIVHSVRTLYSE